ncbi:MAG: 4-hydroxythreonine-4-phosphate dehydrogenase PdxA [Parvibaculum sp.]|uniref:4-hydroxythreonine-4-phosphate dehydrogenase PdxA n=1 Tax=Parvibaculum sp. TaxID=2024848 RepID=UPI00284C9303|nr:4-hydroxythreonine-4-phosphate dehydrogenase PdxA [Parvibaculum sp.]MDR3498555.1 4-hydroxythreonine-4-phosphate dehydrogenase PdxA [Parvibaculum sp.]
MTSPRQSPPYSLPLALTLGEPAGIGPEITLKAWLARKSEALPVFFAIGPVALYRQLADALGLDVPVQAISDPSEAASGFDNALPVLAIELDAGVESGKLAPANARAVMRSIDMACDFALGGRAGGLVTNPIHKRALYEAGLQVPGHTEYLAARTGGQTPVMMLSCPGLRVVPVTVHEPLARVPALLTAAVIVEKGLILGHALRRDLGIARPRIAVAGLNPHAGEEGHIGREEIDIIAPAIEAIRREGFDVSGPLPPDTMFHAGARARYDAALCMYHDQALIPLKTIDFERGVNTTLGLPVVRTSPDHGTALDIAGRGIAHPGSLIEALKLAAEIARNRAAA